MAWLHGVLVPVGVFSRAYLRSAGLSDDQIDRRLRSGRLVAVRRGVLGPADVDFVGHLQGGLAAHGRRRLVVSHLSAARLMRLPKPLSGWDRPEFTCPGGPTRKDDGIRITVAALPPEDVVQRRGLPLTSPARTAADCLRLLHPRDGLAIIDNALHRHLVTREQVAKVIARQTRWPGVARARQVLELADARRESPLESWSAWAFDQAGLPRPKWQVDVLEPGGAFVGRCDCWWPGLAGEADGRSKYRLAAAERGGADANTLFRLLEEERTRERRFRDLGAEVARWGAKDVLSADRSEALARMIRTSQAEATTRHTFRGELRFRH